MRGRWGLIPAHTGKTVATVRAYTVLGAHPRAYGENITAICILMLGPGSSPRIRGKH